MKDLNKEIENITKCFFINYGERSPEIVFNETKLLKVITEVRQEERKKTLEEVKDLLDLNPYTVKEEIDNLLSKLKV